MGTGPGNASWFYYTACTLPGQPLFLQESGLWTAKYELSFRTLEPDRDAQHFAVALHLHLNADRFEDMLLTVTSLESRFVAMEPSTTQEMR